LTEREEEGRGRKNPSRRSSIPGLAPGNQEESREEQKEEKKPFILQNSAVGGRMGDTSLRTSQLKKRDVQKKREGVSLRRK